MSRIDQALGKYHAGTSVPRAEVRPATQVQRAEVPHQHQHSQSEESIDLRQLVWVLFAGKWQILLAACLVVVPVAVATFMAERLYRSTALVQIDPEPVPVLPYKEIDSTSISQNFEVFMKTQEQILRGPKLVSRIATRLQSQPGDTQLSSEASRVGSHLSIQRLETTQLFRLSYVAVSPEIAAKVANMFAEEYIKLHFEVRQDTRERARVLLRRELDGLERAVQVSEKELVKYAQANSIPSDKATPNLVPQKLESLGKQLADAEGERFGARSRVASLGKASIENMPESLVTPVVMGLVSKLAQLEQDLTALRASFGENWPGVVQKRSELDLTRKQLDRERAATLAQARQQAAVDLDAAENKWQSISASLNDQNRLVHQLEGASIQYNIIRREVETNQKLYEGLLERLKQTSVTAGMEFAGFHVVEPATPPVHLDSPKVLWNLALASVLGLALGVCFVVARNYWDNSVSTVEEVEHVTITPVLGMLPLVRGAGGPRKLLERGRVLLHGRPDESRDALTLLDGEGRRPKKNLLRADRAAAEGIRSVCASILLSRSERPPRVVLVTSAVAGEGKTTVASELAFALADTGARTLLVECDIRKPTFRTLFDDLDGDGGLSLFLAGHGGASPTMHQIDDGNLFVVTAGPLAPNPTALLGSEKMAAFLQDMTSSFQFIILDSPPVVPVADARVLSRMAEGVVLVVRAGSISKSLLRRVCSLLEASGANVIGTVLNAIDSNGSGSAYHRHHREYYGQ